MKQQTLIKQSRIIAQAQKLLVLCERMAQSITTSQKEAEQLLQAILREAFTEHASKYQIEETLA